ncbi:MAG: uncharacterized protein QG652_1814, partial [Pseudomonadota bacterium]|nr:uncharacterized protein [Pseudomonadota bacterium]
ESNGTLQLNGKGTVVEYAIRMRQFDTHGLFSRLIDENKISLQHIDTLAERLAGFHASIRISDSGSVFGNAAEIIKPVKQNFDILQPILQTPQQANDLQFIQQYSLNLFETLNTTLQQRKQNNYIRECHGDLHLGNIALSEGEIIIFDGIEFNDSFRWIDTMSDVAFLLMDLQDHRRNDYAAHLLNHYLELTGDYGGLSVLRFYMLYRAMVRAKVAALRLQQEQADAPDYRTLQKQLQNYLDLAKIYTQPAMPFLAIICGISGSGKSWLAQQLADHAHAIVIRSDKERKRLLQDSADNLYSSGNTRKVYEYLLALAEQIAGNGYAVIVDATFIDKTWRRAFQQLAFTLQVPFHILYCHADISLLEQRIRQRQTDFRNISDADIQVMLRQHEMIQDIDESERRFCIDINTGNQVDIDELCTVLRPE